MNGVVIRAQKRKKMNILPILGVLCFFVFSIGCGKEAAKQAEATGATATFSSIQTNILNKSCISCHNATDLQGSLDLSTYAKVTQSTSIVNTSSPSSSKLYTRVKNTAPLMPKNGSALADADTQVILDWITAGALNN